MARVSELLRDAPLRIRARAATRLGQGRDYLETELKKTTGRPGTESNRSRPGEAPRRQTGRGQESIRVKVNYLTLSLTVTANAYMAYHQEHGRPWFTLTWKRVGPQFRRIVFGK